MLLLVVRQCLFEKGVCINMLNLRVIFIVILCSGSSGCSADTDCHPGARCEEGKCLCISPLIGDGVKTCQSEEP